MLDSSGMALDVLPLERQTITDILVLGAESRIDLPEQRRSSGATLMKLFDEPPRPASQGHILDERALKDLVRHMVRDELNAAFGQRLTQKIRSLVRREVLRLMGGRVAD